MSLLVLWFEEKFTLDNLSKQKNLWENYEHKWRKSWGKKFENSWNQDSCTLPKLMVMATEGQFFKIKAAPRSLVFWFLKNFYWNIVDLQCCVSFRCSFKWFSCTYMYKYIYSSFYILFHYRLLQNIEYRSLCYTVSPCWLSILYIVVCIF